MSTLPANESPVSKEILLLIGPIYVGVVVSSILFGISVVQLYIYHISFPNDRRWLQALVYWVFAVDVYLTVVAGSLGWHMLCSGWGREANTQSPGWSFPGIVTGDALMSTTVQMFYGWRIWVLKRWVWLPGIIILVSLAQFVSAMDIAAGISHIQSLAELLPYFAQTTIWLGGGALADILIAIAMFHILFIARNKAQRFRQSERTINRLMAMSLETGSITATCAIIELAFFLAPGIRKTNVHVMFALILGKTYSNAMMANLNSRHFSQTSAKNTGASSTLSFSDTQTSRHEHIPRRRGSIHFAVPTQSAPVVHISSQTEVFADDQYASAKYDKPRPLGADPEDIEMVKTRLSDTTH